MPPYAAPQRFPLSSFDYNPTNQQLTQNASVLGFYPGYAPSDLPPNELLVESATTGRVVRFCRLHEDPASFHFGANQFTGWSYVPAFEETHCNVKTLVIVNQ